MSKTLQKKGTERRKKARGRKEPTSKESPKKKASARQESIGHTAEDVEACHNCSKNLKSEERALFVEEEIGRIFCTEECITEYFAPEIDRLEREYFKKLSSSDLNGDEREENAHLRWITLEEPDEVWREKTLAGDYRYTLVSEFQPRPNKSIWCVCICLFLRGEPSFLYLAFPTRSEAMVNHYRQGERVQWNRPRRHEVAPQGMSSHQQGVAMTTAGNAQAQDSREAMIDGLADDWTEDETIRAQLTQGRREDDIPVDEFELYQGCLEETLETPDEVWSIQLTKPEEIKLYHFIRCYPDENPGIWYIIVARETDNEEQIEILDAFPTRDSELVERYRSGTQEVGEQDASVPSRLVH